MFRNNFFKHTTPIFALIILALVLGIVPALASAHVETVVMFDPTRGQLPEGVAVDKIGNVFVSLDPLGQVRKISPDGTMSEFADIGVPGIVGLAVDAPGNVYAALASGDEDTQGVYKIDRDGNSNLIPGTDSITFPNALAFDKRGNLYVTDTIIGAVWRISPSGSVEMWIQDKTLVGFILPDPGAPPFPIGANGIAYWKGSLYVANSTEAQIVRIPILMDGSAGTPEIFVKNPAELTPLDGIALDVHGNIYALVIAQSKLVRIDVQTKEIVTIATMADGLDFPASLAFGTGKGNRQKLYVTNYAIGPPGAGPALLKVDVGVPGLPLP